MGLRPMWLLTASVVLGAAAFSVDQYPNLALAATKGGESIDYACGHRTLDHSRVCDPHHILSPEAVTKIQRTIDEMEQDEAFLHECGSGRNNYEIAMALTRSMDWGLFDDAESAAQKFAKGLQ